MADKRCENGHFIDESWDICPYCPAAESGEHDMPVARLSRTAPGAEAPANAGPAVMAPASVPAIATPPAGVRREPVRMQTPPMERTVAVQKGEPLTAPRRYVVGWLIGLTGSNRGEAFPIRIGKNVLGRDRQSDIVVNDEQASLHHADLVFRPDERRFILMDHNSTNGTYVNEEEIEPRRDLEGDDIVRIGAHRFLFVQLIRDGFFWDLEGALK